MADDISFMKEVEESLRIEKLEEENKRLRTFAESK